MKKKTSNAMMAVGATLAVCSAAAMMGATKSNSSNAKKAIKKATDKVVSFVDTVSSLM